MGVLELVCSNKPRPSVHKTGKGHQHWWRDVHHIAEQNLRRTLCNRDAADWLIMRAYVAKTDADSADICRQCLSRASSGKGD